MSILRRHRVTPAGTSPASLSARQRSRTRRALDRALSTSPTEATRQELLALESRL